MTATLRAVLYEEVHPIPERALLLDREDGAWRGAILRLSEPVVLQVYGHGVGPNDAPPPCKTGMHTAAQSAAARRLLVEASTVGKMGVL